MKSKFCWIFGIFSVIGAFFAIGIYFMMFEISPISDFFKATEVLDCLKDFPKTTVVFIDVDDTLITPVSKSFRVGANRNPIDEIKANKKEYTNYDEIISNWRLKRRVMLLDKEWPRVISQLKKRFTVYALTKMDTGRFGNIHSMEEWRYKELKSLGIEFSENSIKSSVATASGDPSFYRGILMTGHLTKGEALDFYKKALLIKNYEKVTNLVMIDDRMEQLMSVDSFCAAESIGFMGIHFKGLEKLSSEEQADPKILALQKESLINQVQWLEDDEAEKKLAERAGS